MAATKKITSSPTKKGSSRTGAESKGAAKQPTSPKAKASKTTKAAGKASQTTGKASQTTGKASQTTGKATKAAGKATKPSAAKKAATSKSAKGKAAKNTGPQDKPPKKSSATVAAEKLLEGGQPSDVADLGAQLLGENDAAATKSARVLAEVVVLKPEAVVPLVDRFVAGLTAGNKRVIQTSADALPAIAKVAPARVAKHLDRLKAAFPQATLPGQDGLVRTFAALCSASVAYQRRLEPVLTLALRGADPKTLIQWTEGVLPALKGEPHANARAVVEERLATLPKAQAQHLAGFLGVNLRHHRLR